MNSWKLRKQLFKGWNFVLNDSQEVFDYQLHGDKSKREYLPTNLQDLQIINKEAAISGVIKLQFPREVRPPVQ